MIWEFNQDERFFREYPLRFREIGKRLDLLSLHKILVLLLTCIKVLGLNFIAFVKDL